MGGFEVRNTFTRELRRRAARARNDVKSRSHIHPSFHFLFCERLTATNRLPATSCRARLGGQTLMMTCPLVAALLEVLKFGLALIHVEFE